jgi:hypothetical protein
MKVLSNGVASDEKCIQTDVFIDIVLLNIKFYMSMVVCEEIFVEGGYYCFVHSISLSFGFWYFVHFTCVIFFPVFSVLPILPCKQRLPNIFVTLLPKVTKNQKRKMG